MMWNSIIIIGFPVMFVLITYTATAAVPDIFGKLLFNVAIAVVFRINIIHKFSNELSQAPHAPTSA